MDFFRLHWGACTLTGPVRPSTLLVTPPPPPPPSPFERTYFMDDPLIVYPFYFSNEFVNHSITRHLSTLNWKIKLLSDEIPITHRKKHSLDNHIVFVYKQPCLIIFVTWVPTIITISKPLLCGKVPPPPHTHTHTHTHTHPPYILIAKTHTFLVFLFKSIFFFFICILSQVHQHHREDNHDLHY